jgi:hypothetical protein
MELIYLQAKIKEVAPIVGLSEQGSGWRVDFAPEATTEQREAAQAIIAGWNETQSNNSQASILKTLAKEYHAGLKAENVALRATVALVVDELNVLRQWLADFKTEVASATNLANLQTRVASLPDMTNRTYLQAKNAIESLIENGL